MGKRKAPAEKLSKREKKAKKDPNKPKRAPSAFFVFLLVYLFNFHCFSKFVFFSSVFCSKVNCLVSFVSGKILGQRSRKKIQM